MSAGRNGNDPRRQDGPQLAKGRCPTPGKRGYGSKGRAKIALRRFPSDNRDALHAYRCGCGLFHIGHKPGSRKNRNPQPRPV